MLSQVSHDAHSGIQLILSKYDCLQLSHEVFYDYMYKGTINAVHAL